MIFLIVPGEYLKGRKEHVYKFFFVDDNICVLSCQTGSTFRTLHVSDIGLQINYINEIFHVMKSISLVIEKSRASSVTYISTNFINSFSIFNLKVVFSVILRHMFCCTNVSSSVDFDSGLVRVINKKRLNFSTY